MVWNTGKQLHISAEHARRHGASAVHTVRSTCIHTTENNPETLLSHST